jgi:inorganic pyrophosphatase
MLSFYINNKKRSFVLHHYSLTPSHPWHGISPGENAPEMVYAFIEIVPSDPVKYEIDKQTGHMKVDRPQKFSNFCPSLYGFIPQTICRERVAEYAMQVTGRTGIEGDNDPIDICVLTERPINHGSVIVHARPIGGFRMFDGGEADDKIIATLESDGIYGGYQDISEVPVSIINRLKHYFLTYKEIPDPENRQDQKCVISHTYGAEEAKEVIRRSMLDYQELLQEMQKEKQL